MTKWAANTLSARTAHPVLIGAVLAITLATPASAQVNEAFAVFEARCLAPMVQVRETDTLGLHLITEGNHEETWMAHFRDWQLVRSTSGAVVQFCAMHGTFDAEVSVWAEAAVASGDWVRIDRLPGTLQSTFIREPRVEVEIDLDATPMHLTVIETNLES